MTLTQINKAGLDELALDHVFTIGASGTDHYTFQGEGLNGTVNDPTLYLTRGKTYRFENGTGAHAIRIQSADNGTNGTLYNTGVTNNNSTGTVIVEVQHDAPDVLYYQCASHANMKGTIYITGAVSDGSITSSKIAANTITAANLGNDCVGTAELQNSAVETENIQAGAVTTAKLSNNAVTSLKIAAGAVTQNELGAAVVTTAKIADDAIDASKLASNAVVTASIQDGNVTLDKLPNGTGSNNGKFLRANNGASPSFESVSTDLVADTSPQLGGTLDCNGQAVQFKSGGGNVKIEYDVAADSFDFADNAKSRYGAGNDLQIYHGGTHSDVVNSTGELRLRSNDLRLQNNAATQNYVKCSNGGAVELYYNNTKVLETKALNSGSDSHQHGIKFWKNKAIQFHNDQIGIFTFAFSMNANTWTTMFSHSSYVAATIHVSSVHNAGFSSATWIMSKSASGGNSTVRTGLNDAYGPARLEVGINSNDFRIRSSYGTYGYGIVLVQYNMDGINNVSS